MSDPHMDVNTAVQILLQCLRDSKLSGDETPQTAGANQYLGERLLNYLVLMRSRPLTSTYEFIIPATGLKDAGWYYKPSNSQAFNWQGPYASRKAAVEAKTNRKGAPKTNMQMVEIEIFGNLTEAKPSAA